MARFCEPVSYTHLFETVQPSYQFIKGLFKAEPELEITNDNTMVISPDAGGTGRAIYLALSLIHI